jgi:hypothetical protein
MIFRLSTKLAAKLNVKPSKVLPLDENPFADWSGHVFTAERTQFLIFTNTASLYSTVLYGRGIANDSHFIERAMSSLREFIEDDGLSFIYQRYIAPSSATVQFSKALSRSVTGSMNDLIFHAKVWLTEGELSPHDTAFKLNDIPFSPFKYRKPREVFTGQLDSN